MPDEIANPDVGKSPAFQFYPSDFLSDRNVVVMSMQERGVYITLICHAWQAPLPSDVAQLARICGVPLSAFRKLWPALSICFREQDGGLVHPRLERERQKQADYKIEKQQAGKRGAEKRWQKDGTAMPVPSVNDGRPTTVPMAPGMANDSSYLVLSQSSLVSTQSESSSPAPLTKRAGEFTEWYAEQHSRLFQIGYIGNPQKDYETAQRLCAAFTDAELRDAALVWFGMEDEFATRGTRTIPKFASRATECVRIARTVRV